MGWGIRKLGSFLNPPGEFRITQQTCRAQGGQQSTHYIWGMSPGKISSINRIRKTAQRTCEWLDNPELRSETASRVKFLLFARR